MIARRSWLRPISKRRSATLKEYARLKRRWLADPANQFCRFPACKHRTDDVHHTRGRANGLLIDVQFWVPLCRRHHDWVQMHPKEARELGLIGPLGSWNTPHHD